MRNDTKKKTRGRPRQYDPEVAVAQATEVFWMKGFSATSLDDLSAATGMSRPSIYNAFGDKEDFYRHALGQFVDQLKAAVEDVLMGEPDLEKALEGFYLGALDVYFSDEPAPGCFVVCTAPVEATTHPAVREDLEKVIRDLDQLLTRRFEMAVESGHASESLDCPSVARMAHAMLHSLAVRSRAGESKTQLQGMARHSANFLTRYSQA